jgi:hypothetical protein
MNLRLLCVVAAILLSACAAKGKPTAAATVSAAPQAPMAGRVGVMNLVENKLTHIHSGATPLGNYKTVYPVQHDLSGFLMEELRKGMLTKTPYQPVPVWPTGLLMKNASKWQNMRKGEGFEEAIQRELDGVMKQNALAMLIIVSAPEISDGVTGSTQSLVGSGLYTRNAFGSTKTAVFSTIQFFRLVGTPARIVHPIAAANDRSIGDLPNVKLPDELEGMNVRYLWPVYEPLHNMIRNKIDGLLSLPRKVG